MKYARNNIDHLNNTNVVLAPCFVSAVLQICLTSAASSMQNLDRLLQRLKLKVPPPRPHVKTRFSILESLVTAEEYTEQKCYILCNSMYMQSVDASIFTICCRRYFARSLTTRNRLPSQGYSDPTTIPSKRMLASPIYLYVCLFRILTLLRGQSKAADDEIVG